MPRAIRSTAAVQSVRNAAHNLLPNVAPQVVQSDAMESTLNHAFPESLLAAMPQLSEKPHMGVPSKNPAWHPGFNVCNSTAVLGLQFRCSETVSGPVVAPSNAANPPACQATLLNMANQQLGTNFNSSNVSGSYMNGTAYNIIIQSNQLTAAQFNNIQQGRYTTSGWQYLTGAGLAGHIADETNLGFAQSAFQSSNIGGNLSVSFAFHDDHGYANNPIGALIHWITDVLGHNTRKPC